MGIGRPAVWAGRLVFLFAVRQSRREKTNLPFRWFCLRRGTFQSIEKYPKDRQGDAPWQPRSYGGAFDPLYLYFRHEVCETFFLCLARPLHCVVLVVSAFESVCLVLWDFCFAASLLRGQIRQESAQPGCWGGILAPRCVKNNKRAGSPKPKRFRRLFRHFWGVPKVAHRRQNQPSKR